jgi:hypothetical protein
MGIGYRWEEIFISKKFLPEKRRPESYGSRAMSIPADYEYGRFGEIMCKMHKVF